MRRYKFVFDGDKVDSTLTAYGYLCKVGDAIPGITIGTVKFLLGCVCGLMFMLALPGMAVATFAGMILMFPAAMAFANKKDNVNPALTAFLCIIVYVIPFAIMVEYGIFNSFSSVWRNFLEFNAWIITMGTAPMRYLGANVIMFICDIFSDYEVNMSYIVLARDHWNWWFVMAYHVFIIGPFMLGLFGMGYGMFTSRRSVEAKLGLVFRMVFPMGWLFLALRKNGSLI